MPAADTGLAKARHVFTKHGGMLRTANAIRLGIPRGRFTLSGTLARSNRLVADFTGSLLHRPSPVRIWFLSRFEFRVP